ncbi:MAG: DUF3828 domain-containing protein [Acidobacteria bacterium]|nr:DUF3828 domain-containing protein [Acidobacteriota bacterium]
MSRKEVSNTNVASNPSDRSEPETPAVAGGESQSAAAEALVADLYKQHDAKKSPFYQTKDRARVDKYFTKALADLIWKYSQSASAEEASFDADPLYNAQDLQLKNFAVGRADIKGEAATLPVTFTNFGEKVTINYKLKLANGSWKIDDIMYSPKDGLAAWLKDRLASTPETSAGSGEFEGKYRVGDTTCTVSPHRMAFQIRWAKGSGVEYFYYKDANVFESEEDKSGGRNEFRFDDESYDSGTFVRADGKVFPVTRAR